MIKRLSVVFELADFEKLLEKKEEFRKKNNLHKISWEQFMMKVSGAD